MKAFTVARYGPDALQLSDVPVPSVGPRDVLVDVRAASINPLDTLVRNGEFKQLLKYKPPVRPGSRRRRGDHPGGCRRAQLHGGRRGVLPPA